MYWLDLGKVQEIEDMNIVSQMCAIAVMFVIMYFYISQKKIILHTSKAFVEVWIAGLLSLFLWYFLTCCNWKKKRISSYCYQYYLQIISLDGYMGCHGGLLVYLCGLFSRKKELERKWRKRLWIFGISTDILIMVVPY